MVSTSSTSGIAEGVGRQLDYWRTVYRRTWKGTAISSFVAPLFYVVAMGVLLGGFIEGDPDQLEGATSYLAFLVPGLVAAHAMQTAVGETTYPVMSLIKWDKVYESMLATPLRSRDLVLGTLGFVTFRVASTCAVFMLVLVPFGDLRDVVGSPARVRRAGAGRHGVRLARLRHDHAAGQPRGLRPAVPARGLPAVPVLRRVLPDREPRRRRRLGWPG